MDFVEEWSSKKEVGVEGKMTSSEVKGLSPATSYHIRVEAVNHVGNSLPSEIIQVTTDEEGN